jgi:hypothetical protein
MHQLLMQSENDYSRAINQILKPNPSDRRRTKILQTN